MTQQKPLPIATGITGGGNIPSSFHPEVPPRDKIWRMLLGRGRQQPRRDRWGGDCGGRGRPGPKRCASSGEGDSQRLAHREVGGEGRSKRLGSRQGDQLRARHSRDGCTLPSPRMAPAHLVSSLRPHGPPASPTHGSGAVAPSHSPPGPSRAQFQPRGSVGPVQEAAHAHCSLFLLLLGSLRTDRLGFSPGLWGGGLRASQQSS